MIHGWIIYCAIRQQAITWANVDPDLCRHKTSLGIELTWINFDISMDK